MGLANILANLGIFNLVPFCSLVLVGVRNKPEDMGLLPDGAVDEKFPKSEKKSKKTSRSMRRIGLFVRLQRHFHSGL
ncbi:hypothetical protein [Halalkalibacter lacteus]|uniref:hypothetical protein n=1 Tax=Halalkalibacter lacteus TaxID=3090663 RepID=UPI002FC90873